MKVEISNYGSLKIKPETGTEQYALDQWINNSLKYKCNEDLMLVAMGSFDISTVANDSDSLIDNVVEREDLEL